MKWYKKTSIASIIAFVVGTSCCWMSSLAIWIGGAALLGTITRFVESTQWLLIILAGILAVVSLFLYLRHRNDSS